VTWSSQVFPIYLRSTNHIILTLHLSSDRFVYNQKLLGKMIFITIIIIIIIIILIITLSASQCWGRYCFCAFCHATPTVWNSLRADLTDNFDNMLLSGFKCSLKTYFYKLSFTTKSQTVSAPGIRFFKTDIWRDISCLLD